MLFFLGGGVGAKKSQNVHVWYTYIHTYIVDFYLNQTSMIMCKILIFRGVYTPLNYSHNTGTYPTHFHVHLPSFTIKIH